MRELSRISGVHEVSLYRYCSGLACPSPRSLTKLAMTLARVPKLPIDLFGAEPEKRAEARSFASAQEVERSAAANLET